MRNKKTLLIAVLVVGLLISFLAFMNELSFSSDADGDGIVDSQDNCPNIPNPAITVNGKIQNDFDIKHGLLFNHSMIRIEPTESGVVLIKNE